MLKKLGLPAVVLGTALSLLSPAAALARDHDRDDHGRDRCASLFTCAQVSVCFFISAPQQIGFVGRRNDIQFPCTVAGINPAVSCLNPYALK